VKQFWGKWQRHKNQVAGKFRSLRGNRLPTWGRKTWQKFFYGDEKEHRIILPDVFVMLTK